MTHSTNRKPSLIAVSALLSGLLLAGCDEYVQITRDPDVPIHKLATWAWRPAAEQANARDSRAVISRDMISRDETVVRDSDADNEMVRQRVKTAIEQTLASKGLTQISDAQAADFLVDYHFAVERRNVTVPVWRLSGCGLRTVWLLAIVGLGAGGSRLPKHSLPPRNHCLRFHPAVDEASGLPRRRGEARAIQHLHADPGRYPCSGSSSPRRPEDPEIGLVLARASD